MLPQADTLTPYNTEWRSPPTLPNNLALNTITPVFIDIRPNAKLLGDRTSSDLVELTRDVKVGWIHVISLNVGVHHHRLSFDDQHTLVVQF